MNHARRAWNDSETYTRMAQEARERGDQAEVDYCELKAHEAQGAAIKFSAWRKRGDR